MLAIRRVVILTSIDAGALRGDLADRLLPIDLERLTEGERRLDEDLAEAFTRAHPSLLGALCSLVSEVLALLPTVRLSAMPRMADAARVMAAVDLALGTDSLKTYRKLGQRVAAEVVEGDPVAAALCALVRSKGSWTGTPADLLEEIRPEHPGRGWPADATRLSGHLRRAAPTLRSVGVDVEQVRNKGTRLVRLSGVDAEGSGVDAGVDASDSASTPNPQVTPQMGSGVDAEDAKTPTSLCWHSTEEGGNGPPVRDEGKTASSASSVHPDEMTGACHLCSRRTGLKDEASRWRCSRCRVEAEVR